MRKNKMARVLLGDVAQERRESIKTNKDKLPIVGLEHLIPQQIQLTEWSTDADNTFTKMFHKGDVLFGRRRAYLKKASVAPFDGICSGDITTIAPIPEKIVPELLPFIIQNDTFFDYAVGKSAGSLSPRVKWEYLKKYEFELPSLEKQHKLAKILWAAEETKQAYKKLLQKTDDAVKAKFEEMFGNISTNKFKWNIKKIKEVATCIAGATPSTEKKEYWQNGTIPWLSSGEVHKERIFDTDKKITQLGYDNCSTKFIPAHTVVLALAGQGKTRGTVAVAEIRLCTNQSICSIVNNSSINTDYLYYYLKLQYNELRNVSNGAGGRGGLNLSIVGQFKILLPPLPLQDQFAEILQQAEQSKRQLKQSLESLNDMMHALVNQSFN